MSLTRRRSHTRTGTTVAALTLGLVALVAGCGKDDPAPVTDPTPTPSPSLSESRTPTTPTSSASTTPTPTPTSSPTPAGSVYDRLLPANRLPGFNETWTWSVRGTTTDAVKLGTCARFPLETLGAEQSVTRSFEPTGDEGGGFGRQSVATFVDTRSADQAMAVLRTFHDTCQRRLTGFAKVSVAAVRPVRVDRGQASWYLTTTVAKGADDGHFNALGVLRDGTTIELVELDVVGQDYNYESGSEPMVRALRNAAARLS